MFSVGDVNVSVILFFGLFAAALADLYFRYAAFGRIESVAIDIALYTSLYSLSEAVGNHKDSTAWAEKAAIGIAILLILSTTHSVAYRIILQKRVAEYLDDVREACPESARAAVRSTSRLIRRTIPLTIELSEDGIRQGKKEVRTEAEDALIKVLSLAGMNQEAIEDLHISGEKFLLPFRERLGLGLTFTVGSTIALIVPIVTIIT